MKVDGPARGHLTGGQVPERDRDQPGSSAPSTARPATSCCSWPTSAAQVRHVLGILRTRPRAARPVNEGGLHFLWVVDFPLFEALDDDGLPIPAHHPFTMPHPDDLRLLDVGGEALLDVRSQAYDLTLNGWELGSGSVRIHQPDVQRRIFELLGIDEATANERFGFLLDAFRYGAPPHAGFAFGIDRLVAILAGEENIREVIAFPKTQSGADPLTGAPSAIADRHLTELGLRMLPAQGLIPRLGLSPGRSRPPRSRRGRWGG